MKFGTDGVRGVANTELTAEFALRLGTRRGPCARRPATDADRRDRRRHAGVDRRCSTRRSSAGFARRRRRRGPLGVGPDSDGRVRGAAPRCAWARWCRPRTIRTTTTASSCSRPAGTKLSDDVEAAHRDANSMRSSRRSAIAGRDRCRRRSATDRPRTSTMSLSVARAGAGSTAARRRRRGERCGASVVARRCSSRSAPTWS